MSLHPLYKFLSWLSFLIFICFIGIFKVCALTNNDTLVFYDNSGSSLTQKTTSYVQQIDESSAIFTTTANSYGGAVMIQLSTPLISGHIYSLFLNVGAGNMGGYTVASSKNCIGIGTTYSNTVSNYINCSITPKFTQSSGKTTDNGIGIYFTFIANNNASYLLVPYTSSNTCTDCYQFSHGYNITDGGDTNGLSQTEVNNIINQQTTTIQNQISNMQSDFTNALEDSTQQQIDSQKVCNYIDKNNIELDGKRLDNNGNVSNFTSTGITNYIKLNSNSELKLISTTADAVGLCFYNTNKELISCEWENSLTLNQTITIPTNTSYLRATIRKATNVPTFQLCQNGNQALNDSVNDLNSSINNDDTGDANNDTASFITGFNTDTFGLTSIITAPLNLIQSLTSSSCTPLHLPLPYLNNKYLDLPCMTSIYQQHFGTFFTLYQTITYGIIAYWVCVRIFNHVKDFKNPEHDEIEVVDL